MVDFGTGFALACAPNQAGCKFGFAVGDLNAFYSIIEQDYLPITMRSDPNSLSMFEKTHLNVVLTLDETYKNTIVRNGTINGFICPSESSTFFFKKWR